MVLELRELRSNEAIRRLIVSLANKKGKICRKNFMPSAKDARLEFLPHGTNAVRRCMAFRVRNIKAFQQWKVQKDSWSLGWKGKISCHSMKILNIYLITQIRQLLPIQITQSISNEPELVAYVDGSYDQSTKRFSYGMVILENGEEKTFNKSFYDPSLAGMRNVAGEIMGARAAMEYAIANNKKRLVIYHDYEGIAKWPLGIWKTNKEGTIAYKAYYDEAKTKVSVRFQKVTGHSGDKYNDYADKLAKQALGLA